MRHERDDETIPSRWLTRAREQSHALADARARAPQAFISPPPTRTRLGARHSLVWVPLATLAMLLVGSGAWALVARFEHARHAYPAPAPITPPPTPRAIAKRPAAPAIVPSLPSLPLAKRKHRAHTLEPIPPAPTPPPDTQTLERGDGEIIIVPPVHDDEPPLFSPDDWKRAHQPPDPPR